MIKKVLFMCFLAISTLTANAQQDQALPIDPKVRIGKLDNGLTYYIRHNEEPKGQAAFYIAHKVGAVQEEDNQRGLAHFLEHMAFNGSKHFPAGSVFGFIQRIGVTEFNAETGIDMTYYHLDNAPVTNPLVVDSCMLLLSDWSCQVELSEKEIEQERDVIHGEYRMRDNAQQRMITRQLSKLYPGSKYADRMPIGVMEVIDNFSPAFLEAYYKKWYHPDLQAVIVVGDVDVDAIEGKIKTLFSDLKNPENEAAYELYPVPDNDKAIYAIDSDKEQKQTTLLYNFKQPIMPFEARGGVQFIAQNYINYVTTKMLNERLTEVGLNPDCPYIVAQAAYGNYIVSKTCDALSLTILPKPGKSAEASKVVMTEIARARVHGFTEGEVQRANDEFLSQLEQIYNNREKMNSKFYAQQYLKHFLEGNAIPDIETEFQITKALTSQVPSAVFQQYLSQLTASMEKNFVLFAMCPDTDVPTEEALREAVNTGMSTQTEAYVDEAGNEPFLAELPQPVKIQKENAAAFGFTQWQLSNGANVYFKKTDFSDDAIEFEAISKGGMNQLGNELVPLTSVFLNPNNGQELTFFDIIASETGIGNFTGNQFHKKLAGKQVAAELKMGDNTDIIEGNSTIKDLRTLFELINLRFQGPSNDQVGYDNIMSQLSMVLPQLDAMHSIIQADSLRNTIFNHNPRKQMLHANIANKVNYDMVRQAIAERYQNAGDFDFIFAGPINEDSLRAYVEQYIAPLPGTKKRESMNEMNYSQIKGITENTYTCKMQSQDASESIVNVRWSYNAPFTVKSSQINLALSRILSDRYFQQIREENSMGYNAGAYSISTPGKYSFYAINASANIKPERKDECLDIMYKVIEDVAKNGVTEDELKKYKEPALTNYAQKLRDNGFWINAIEDQILWGLDNVTGKEEIIKNITSADVQKFAKALLKAGNRATVVMMPEL